MGDRECAECGIELIFSNTSLKNKNLCEECEININSNLTTDASHKLNKENSDNSPNNNNFDLIRWAPLSKIVLRLWLFSFITLAIWLIPNLYITLSTIAFIHLFINIIIFPMLVFLFSSFASHQVENGKDFDDMQNTSMFISGPVLLVIAGSVIFFMLAGFIVIGYFILFNINFN